MFKHGCFRSIHGTRMKASLIINVLNVMYFYKSLKAQSASVEVSIKCSHDAQWLDHVAAVMWASRGPAATTTSNPDTRGTNGTPSKTTNTQMLGRNCVCVCVCVCMIFIQLQLCHKQLQTILLPPTHLLTCCFVSIRHRRVITSVKDIIVLFE